ncbi:MAG: heme-binding protein [Planctomycetota bacterium]
MQLKHRRITVSIAAVLTCGVAYAAGRGERMESPAYIDELLADLSSAAKSLEPHSPAREALQSGEIDAAREMLSFRPYDEAPLPEGFPKFTPVGVIEVKHYPAYRKAVGSGFWPLFQHIQTQSIPMTAPVEMTRTPANNGRGEMAFLYQSTAVGEPGPIDGVAVEDTPATLVASLGMRGPMGEGTAEQAKETLQAWLADQSEYQAAGDTPFRLFGYNSPSVPDADKYWEAQMLIEPLQAPAVE